MRRFLTIPILAAAACTSPAIPSHDVQLASSGAGNPTVAVDEPSRLAYAAWVESNDVYLAVIDSTGNRTTVRVNDIPGDAAPHDQAPPQVALGPDRAVYVVWQNNTEIPGRRFPASNLRFARSLDGGRTFEPAIFVNDDAHDIPASHTFQDIAVADDGTILVSWIDGRARAQAELDGTATGHHPGSEVLVARSVDGGRSFGPGVVIHRDVCPCCRTSLATHGSTVAVALRVATDDMRDIAVATSSDGGATFGEPVRVHRDGWHFDGCPHAGASLAFDDAGRLHVAWYTGAADRQGLWYAMSSDGRTFSEPLAIQAGEWVPVSQVKLTTDRDGSVWIAWDDRRESQSVVRIGVVDGGLRTLPVEIAGHSPAIAAGGRVVVGWQNADSAAARLLLPD